MVLDPRLRGLERDGRIRFAGCLYRQLILVECRVGLSKGPFGNAQNRATRRGRFTPAAYCSRNSEYHEREVIVKSAVAGRPMSPI